MGSMRFRIVFVALVGFSAAAGAQVIRCVDAAGSVSYTDQHCPPGTRLSGQVMGVEATRPPLPSVSMQSSAPPPPEPAPATSPTPASAAPVGPTVRDSRAEERIEAQQREIERLRREADEARDAAGDYPYPGFYPRPRIARPRDMRPELRSCDAAGCNDTIGNHYDRSGKVDRYRGLDGKTCRPIGSTVVCQ